MDLLELALNPVKAQQRMSPFTNELPKGQARALEYYFGDRASDDPAERVLYSKDAATPPTTLSMLLKRDAWAVVRPNVRGDLFELIRYANRNGVPIVPRGAGTSGYGGAVPTEGGVVVDMRAFNKVLAIDEEGLTVTVEANATFSAVETALRAKGLALRQYPTSFLHATLAGWYAQGGGGIGSNKYGPFRNDVLEVGLIAPDGTAHRLAGKELDLVSETHGTAGFIVEMTLRVRKATKEAVFLATFDNAPSAHLAARRVALEAKPWTTIVITPEYAELVNAAATQKLLPTKNGVLVALEDDTDARAIEIIKGAILTSGGSFTADKDAKRAWDNRFQHLNVKRLGPSVVVSEAAVPITKLHEGIVAAQKAHRMERACVWAIAVSPDEWDIVFYGLEDERRATYPLAMGNAIAVVDAVKDIGGRSYSTGVLASTESRDVLGAERLKLLKKWRKETDPKSVFNPGPVLGPRTRMMPLPVRDFPAQMRLAAPMLKLQRGWFEYHGADQADPYVLAYGRGIGRVHAGQVGSLATEVSTCIFCGFCNAVAPETRDTPWESAMPRGRVWLAKSVIEGRATLSPRVHHNIARTALEHGPDAVCPTLIPIQRVTDLLLAACVEQFGPLPAHAAIAESVKANGNALGKPADARNKWVNVGFDPVATTAFLADDVAAYEAPEVAKSAALALVNAGFSVGHMGKADATSGATLFETGQRATATEVVVPFLEALAKRGVTHVVTPDANAARAIALDWPLVGAENEVAVPTVRHTGEVFAELIKAKKLEFGDEKPDRTVVVHLPEGLTPAQRDAVLEVAKATGAKVLDWAHHECGHGRGLKEYEPALAQRMAEECLKSAMAAGAQSVVTMSPGCHAALSTAAKKAKAGVEVLDLHTMVATTMRQKEGGAAAAPVVVEAEEEAPKEPVIGPDQFRVELVKEGVVLAVGKNQTILEAGEEAGLELPSSCRAGSCDTCSAKWEGTAPDQSAGEALSPDQQKTYVLTCIARPKGPVKIWSDERP